MYRTRSIWSCVKCMKHFAQLDSTTPNRRFIPHFTGHVITYLCWDLKLNHVRKRGQWSQGQNGRWSHRIILSMRFSGTDLNDILSTFVDYKDEINNFHASNYFAMANSQLSNLEKWLLHSPRSIYKTFMQSMVIFIQLWTICLHMENILALFVFTKLNWRLKLTWHYLK